MAESDTILQLGIEAAREGNREEARNLFSLLTRQEPDNVQAWLWLAGVAESTDERRAALERVVDLDPSNEMAQRGLQAMGVSPQSSAGATVAGASGAAAVPNLRDVDPAPSSASPRNLSEEEMYAAELDSAFDDYDAVEKVGGGPRNNPTTYFTDDEAAAAAAGATTARERIDARRNNRRAYDDDDAAAPPPRRGLSGIALALLGLIAVLALVAFLPRFLNRDNGSTAGGDPTSQTATADPGGVGIGAATADAGATADATNAGGVTGTGVQTDTGAVAGTGGVTNTGEITGTGTTDGGQPAAPTPAAGGQPAATGNFPDPATANPQVVGVGTQLEASGFSYTFPAANFAAGLGTTIGGFTSQGRFVEVLVYVGNNTGTVQPVPADLFVLKDAQGRVYNALPEVSNAFVQRGINADIGMQDPLAANGLQYSVPLIFDVAPDATNLVLFTRPNQGQGFQVLNAVP
jgi:hypothetical protein